MKRVVTATDQDGKSYIGSITELEDGQPTTLFEYDPAEIAATIAAIDPSITADWIGPDAPGGVIWRYTPMKPYTGAPHNPYPGIDAEGFHTSRTIDFDVVLEGELTLVLDRERIRLERGDVVIQWATRHAWRNEGDTNCVLLALVHRPATSSASTEQP